VVELLILEIHIAFPQKILNLPLQGQVEEEMEISSWLLMEKVLRTALIQIIDEQMEGTV